MVRRLAVVLALGAVTSAPFAIAGEPPPRQNLCPGGETGCYEQCGLPDTTKETASLAFLAKLRSIAPTKHHVDTVYGADLVERLPWLRIVNFGGLGPEAWARWQQNRRYAGPCTTLLAVFHSKVVENADAKNVVDLYELRYPDASTARRVQSLLTFPTARIWDWNYHPYSAAYDDRSVFVVEGRWRAWSAFKNVATHFGAPIFGKQTVLPPCGPSPEGSPLLALAGMEGNPALSVFALGFSTTGRLAWLEQRTGGRDIEWSVQIVDLINDRALPGKVVRGTGTVAAMCARHGPAIATLLADHDIQPGAELALEQPAPGKDPTGVELRPAARPAAIDVMLRAAAGEKRIGTLVQAAGAGAPSVLGFLRSPFEPRVAVAVLQSTANPRRSSAIHFFGGRLDKRWTPPGATPPPTAAPSRSD